MRVTPDRGSGSGGSGGAREQIQNAGQKIQQGVEQVSNRLSEGYDSARETAAHGYRQAEGLVARNPGQSVLVGFGVGFGLGVLLTVLLTREEERPWYDRYADRLRGLPDYARDHLHSAHDTIRHGVEEMSRRLPDSLRR